MKEKINEKKSLLREAEKLNDTVPKKRCPRRDGVLGRLLTKLIIVLVLVIILLGGGYYVFTKKIIPEPKVNISIVSSQLSLCQELVTAKYYYSEVVTSPKTALKGKLKRLAIVKFSGVIRIGIADLTKSEYEIDTDSKVLKIKLPDVEILGNDISNYESYDEVKNLFVPISTGEVLSGIQKTKDDISDELVNDKIKKDARTQAAGIIQQMFLAAGFEEVIVDFME
jgi:hypothetical protein